MNDNWYDSRTGVAEVVELGKIGLGQVEQLRTLSENMYGCLYSTVKVPGDNLASVEVSLTLFETFGTHRTTDTHTQRCL